MANNRMYLRCKGCGELIMLGKVFTDELHFVKPYADKGKELSDFLQEHSDCCKDLEDDTCDGISPFDSLHFKPFELVYESDNDFGEKQTLQEKDKELHQDK